MRVVIVIFIIMFPVLVSGALLACSFGYKAGLHLINFPFAGLLFVTAVITEMDKIFVMKYHQVLTKLPDELNRELKSP